MTTSTSSSPPGERPPIVSTAVTLGLLAIMASVGVWRATHSATAPLPEPAAQRGTTLPASVAPAVPTGPGLTVYLVGSEEEHAFVLEALNLVDAVQLPETSLACLVVACLIVDVSAPGGEAVAQAIASDANVVRPDGRPAVMLVDLRATLSDQDQPARRARARAAAPPDGDDSAAVPSIRGTQPVETWHVVSSRAEAEALQPLPPDEMVLVWGTEQTDRLLRARLDLEMTWVRVVDRTTR
jgi:hypothetical protein